MKGYRIAFVRHGMTEANENGKYIGITDLPLSDNGAKALIEKAGELRYPRPQKVYTSPLKRCKQTAGILFPNCYTAELGELREMDFGTFENRTVDELMETEEYKKFIKGGLDNPPPGGESLRQVVSRCYEALKIIISDMMYEGMTSAAVVTHGGIIMNTLACFGLPKHKPMEFACDFGEGFEILVTAAMWQRSEAFEILGRYPDGENESGDEPYHSEYDEFDEDDQ